MAALDQTLAAAGSSGLSSAAGSFGSGTGSAMSDALFGGIIAQRQWRYQQKQMALQQKYALEQMARAAQYQKEAFEYQNEYNAPSAVFDRFRRAGVSPAAVLGSSGASMGTTLSAPSAPSGGSGPSGGSPIGGRGPAFGGDPASIATYEMTRSNVQRNEAAAEKDEAFARYIEGETHSSEYRRMYDDTTLVIQDLARDNAALEKEMNKSRATLLANDAMLSTVTYGYRLQEVQAQTGLLVEEYERYKSTTPRFAEFFGAQIAVNNALAFYYEQTGKQAGEHAKLTRQQLLDAEAWFRNNWQTQIEVPVMNTKGEVVDKKKMTVQEAVNFLTANQAAASVLSPYMSWAQFRSQKNALGYGITQSLANAAGFAGAAYVSRGRSATAGTTTTRSYSGPNGEFLGGYEETRIPMLN